MNISKTERKIAAMVGCLLSIFFGFLGAAFGTGLDKVLGTGGLFAILGVCTGTWGPLLAVYLVWFNGLTSRLISSGFKTSKPQPAVILTRRSVARLSEAQDWQRDRNAA